MYGYVYVCMCVFVYFIVYLRFLVGFFVGFFVGCFVGCFVGLFVVDSTSVPLHGNLTPVILLNAIVVVEPTTNSIFNNQSTISNDNINDNDNDSVGGKEGKSIETDKGEGDPKTRGSRKECNRIRKEVR